MDRTLGPYGIELAPDAESGEGKVPVAWQADSEIGRSGATSADRRNVHMRECTSREYDISQAIRRIVSTRPDTLPISTEFGCRVHELLFRPLTPAVRVAMRFFVEAAITRWEQRVEELDVSIEGPSNSNVVRISVKWRARENSGEERFATTDDGSELSTGNNQ